MSYSPDARDWNRSVTRFSHAQFLQSWEWGAFQESLSRTVTRVQWRSAQGEYEGCSQGVDHQLTRFHWYTHISRGPVAETAGSAERTLVRALRASRERGAVFARVEPLDSLRESELLVQSGVRVRDVQPSHTLLLDLSHSREELLEQMHHKTRYNIGLSQRKGVSVSRMSLMDEKERGRAFQSFHVLLRQTSRRDRFSLHPLSYYSALVHFFPPADGHVGRTNPSVEVFIATYQGSPIAATLVMYFGDTATYLHGASGDTNRDVMAPYLVQWEAIQAAQTAGCRWYDFWGVAPDTDSSHALAGVTRFKCGFGGSRLTYPGAYDMVFKPFLYRAYQILKYGARVKRALSSFNG